MVIINMVVITININHIVNYYQFNTKVEGFIFNDLDTSKASYYGYYQYGGYNNKYKSYS